MSHLDRYRKDLGDLVGGISALVHSVGHLVGDVANHIGGYGVRETEGDTEQGDGTDTPLDSLAQLDHNATMKRGELHATDNKMTHSLGFTAGR